MIFKTLNIIKSELSQYLSPHLKDGESVVLGNIAMLESNTASGTGTANSLEGKVVISLVGVQEEKTLRNLPNFKVQNGQTIYKNAPVHLNLFVLIAANSSTYDSSLKYLSQIIKFFQGKNILTHLNAFEQNNDPANQEETEAFRLIIDLHSTTFEESNYLWSTLGGKQLPSVCYKIRVIALERDLPQGTSGTITEIEIKEP